MELLQAYDDEVMHQQLYFPELCGGKDLEGQ